jgi:hypothetical protein
MSTLLVQNIKHTNGTTAATVNSSGVFASAGHVLQIVQATATDKVSINNTNTKCLECSFAAKGTGSKFYVSTITSIRKGDDTGNLDRDRGLGLGFKTGSTSTSSSDYDPVAGVSFDRESITGTSSSNLIFTAADTYYSAGLYDERYFNMDRVTAYHKLFTPSSSVSAGTTVNFALYASCDFDSIVVFGGNNTFSNSGIEGSVTVQEIGQ